jgi:hypothetical protein
MVIKSFYKTKNYSVCLLNLGALATFAPKIIRYNGLD